MASDTIETTEDKIDTIPLLEELDSSPRQTLSRGELRSRGIADNMIDEAERLEQVYLSGNVENTKNGSYSSMVSITITDLGEQALDNAGV